MSPLRLHLHLHLHLPLPLPLLRNSTHLPIAQQHPKQRKPIPVLGVMAQRQPSRKPSSTFQPRERVIVRSSQGRPPFRISMIFSIPLSRYRILLHLLTSGLNPTILANLLRHFDGRSNTYTISAPLCACACGVHCNFFSFAAACIIKPRHQIAHIILRTHWK
ncbi:hypothetical protein P692DRAFT_201811364 [Suillus brevipes Sb2]|nr:hypothetical protein P692DRAFT_201811364 [Suillus brevipes Sb2]